MEEPHNAEKPRDSVQLMEFGTMVVQEFLKAYGLVETVDAFHREWQQKGLRWPSPDAWYQASASLDINQLTERYKQSQDSEANNHVIPVLEVLLDALLNNTFSLNSSRDNLKKATVKVSKRPNTVQALDRSSSSPEIGPRMSRAWETRSSSLRPQAKSSICLLSRKVSRPSVLRKLNDTDTKPKESTPSYLVHALNEANPQKHVKIPHSHSKTMDSEKRRTTRSRSEHLASGRRKKDTKQNHEDSTDDDLLKCDQKWLSHKQRHRMIARDFNVLQLNHRDKLIYKEQKKTMQHRKEVEEQLEQRRYDAYGKKLVQCMLCTVHFKKYNLPLSISYKSIMDLRRQWDPDLPELNPVLAKPPQCYNQVRVCTFCAQFLDNVNDYRPSHQARVRALKEKQQAEAQIIQEQLEKERNKHDPLDYESPNSACSGGSDDYESDDEVRVSGVGAAPIRRKKRIPTIQSTVRVSGAVGRRVAYSNRDLSDEMTLDAREWKILKET